MKRAVIYCRVSTKEQASNLSLPTQLSSCRDYCERHGYEVDSVFEDAGESAKTIDRTEFKLMLEHCRLNKKRLQAVVVYNLTRFSRNTNDHTTVRALLNSLGIVVRSATEQITDDASGKLLENMLAAIGQFDNDVKSDRTKAGMRAALELGRWTWRAPLGFVNGRVDFGEPSLQPDPVRAPQIVAAFEMIANERISQRDALRRVTALGLRTRTGRPLTPQTFGKLLQNPIYAGLPDVSAFGVKGFRADFAGLVSLDLFRRAKTVLRGSKGRERHVLNNPEFPLRRFVVCGKCSTPLTGSTSRGRTSKYAYYHCRCCQSVRIKKNQLEAGFAALLETLQPRPEFVRLFRAVVLDVLESHRLEAASLGRQIAGRITGLRQRERQLEEAYVYENRIDEQTYDRQRDLIREDLALAQMEFDEARVEEIDAEGVFGFAEFVLTNASRLWSEAEPEHKQKLQAVLFPEKITFSEGRFGTAVTCLAFNQLGGFVAGKESMASPPGFEPGSWP